MKILYMNKITGKKKLITVKKVVIRPTKVSKLFGTVKSPTKLKTLRKVL